MDAVVGTEHGLLMGVHFASKELENYVPFKQANRSRRIARMCWCDDELIYSTASGVISMYNFQNCQSTELVNCHNAADVVQGLEWMGEKTLTVCFQSGDLFAYSFDGHKTATLKVGQNVCRMRKSRFKTNLLATGGKENDLKVWDFESKNVPIFSAKNVSDDYLDLRSPIWVRDMTFLDDKTVVVSTAHGKLRAYDILCGRRRPIAEYDSCCDTSFNCVAQYRDFRIVAGCTRGKVALYDMRGKNKMVHAFKGFAGGITELVCHPTLPYLGSASVDRFLRLHNVENKREVHRVYCKSQLSCLLFTKSAAFADKPREEDCQVVSDAEEVESSFEDSEEADEFSTESSENECSSSSLDSDAEKEEESARSLDRKRNADESGEVVKKRQTIARK